MFGKVKEELTQGKTLLQFGFLQATGRTVAMLTPLVVAKFFSKDLFGRYALSEMIIYFFVGFLITSTKAPFIVCASQERTNSGKINKAFTVQTILLLTSLFLFMVVSVVFKKPLTTFAKISATQLMFIGLGFLGVAFKDYIGNVFMALNQRVKYAFVELTFGLVAILLVMVFHLTNQLNLKSIFLTYLFSTIVVCLVFVSSIDFKRLLPFDFDKQYLIEMLHLVKWTAFGVSAVYFINWGGNIVLRYYGISMGDIGAYNLGYKFFKGLTMLVYILSSYFLPFISENISNREKIRVYLSRKRPRIILLGIVVLIIVFFITPFFLNLIYQDKFDDSVPVIRILLVATGLLLYAVFYGPIYYALKEFRLPQIFGIIQVAINVVLNLILIPKYGIKGAAVATVFAYLFFAAAIDLYFRFRLKKLIGLGAKTT